MTAGIFLGEGIGAGTGAAGAADGRGSEEGATGNAVVDVSASAKDHEQEACSFWGD